MTEVLAFVEGPIGIFVLAKLLKKSGLSGGPTTDDFLEDEEVDAVLSPISSKLEHLRACF